jgi:hypothetical protein
MRLNKGSDPADASGNTSVGRKSRERGKNRPPGPRAWPHRRRRTGIANSDAGAAAFINVAIDEAHRAVQELLQRHGLK